MRDEYKAELEAVRKENARLQARLADLYTLMRAAGMTPPATMPAAEPATISAPVG